MKEGVEGEGGGGGGVRGWKVREVWRRERVGELRQWCMREHPTFSSFRLSPSTSLSCFSSSFCTGFVSFSCSRVTGSSSSGSTQHTSQHVLTHPSTHVNINVNKTHRLKQLRVYTSHTLTCVNTSINTCQHTYQ